jgi:hypothetical protein
MLWPAIDRGVRPVVAMRQQYPECSDQIGADRKCEVMGRCHGLRFELFD